MVSKVEEEEITAGSLSHLAASLIDFAFVATPRMLVLQREPAWSLAHAYLRFPCLKSLGISLDGMVVHGRVTCSMKWLHLGGKGHYSDPAQSSNLGQSSTLTSRSMHLLMPSTDSAIA